MPAATKPATKVVKATKAVEAAPVATKAEEAPVVEEGKKKRERKVKETPAVDEEELTTSEGLRNIASQMDGVAKLVRILSQELRKLARRHDSELKQSLKGAKGKGKRPRDPNRPPKKPSGFAKPAPISAELAAFLGVDATTEMARTDVTRKITEYIKENDLQNPENRREIQCDEALGKLLSPGENVLTYFNLQTYLKPHFPRQEAAAATA